MEPNYPTQEITPQQQWGTIHYKDQYAAVLALNELRLLHPEFTVSLRPVGGSSMQEGQMSVLASPQAIPTIDELLGSPEISLLDYASKPHASEVGVKARLESLDHSQQDADVYRSFFYFHKMQQFQEQREAYVQAMQQEKDERMKEINRMRALQYQKEETRNRQQFLLYSHGSDRDTMFAKARNVVKQTVQRIAPQKQAA